MLFISWLLSLFGDFSIRTGKDIYLTKYVKSYLTLSFKISEWENEISVYWQVFFCKQWFIYKVGQYSAYNGFGLILEKILTAFKKIQSEYSVYWKIINLYA